jgi:hypothetical protein
MTLETRVKKIRKWLMTSTTEQITQCPFEAPTMCDKHCTFCKGLFNSKYEMCPCGEFGRTIVVTKAKQFVEAWDKIHKEDK